MIDIKISDEPLNIQSCIDRVMCPQCGGIDVFIGTVRSETKKKPVIRLEFEAYKTMAENEMKKIAQQASEKWAIQNILMHHRVGVLQVGEIAVIIAAAAPNRDAAFMACRYAIDTLKKKVPIWKKEIFQDGEVWVSAYP